MHSCTTRTLLAVFFVVAIALPVSAAPEGRSEGGDWIGRQISRIVQQIKNVFAPSPLDDSQPVPPHP
jgi:hypothetical protein